jgi:hypothetical protein
MWGMAKLETVGTRFIDKYRRQKVHANHRGIPFDLSFDEWLSWWGEDIHNRGRGVGKLQMCRKSDLGGYTLDNIYKASHEQNSSDKFAFGFIGRKAIVNNEIANRIKKTVDSGVSTRTVAKLFNVSQRTVMRIKLQTNHYSTI